MIAFYWGCFLINCCFFIKITLWPFHGWVRNFYEAVPWYVLGFFLVISKIVACYLLLVVNINVLNDELMVVTVTDAATVTFPLFIDIYMLTY